MQQPFKKIYIGSFHADWFNNLITLICRPGGLDSCVREHLGASIFSNYYGKYCTVPFFFFHRVPVRVQIPGMSYSENQSPSA